MATPHGSDDSRGWIKLHRRLQDHPRFRDSEWVHVWLYLLMNATHKPIPALFKGEVITLQPGQLITGRQSIAAKTGVNEFKVFRILNTLKSEQQITQQTSNLNSLVTILNWDEHQDTAQPDAQPVHNDCTTTAQPVHTNKNRRTEEQKNIYNGEELPIGETDAATEILKHLNDRTGRHFQIVDTNLKPIRARLGEIGGDVPGMKKMIDRLVVKWTGGEYEEYLCPGTLFRPEKFQKYYTNRDLPIRADLGRLQVIATAVQKEIDSHPANPQSLHHDQACSPEKRAEFKGLKERLKELNQRIAMSK